MDGSELAWHVSGGGESCLVGPGGRVRCRPAVVTLGPELPASHSRQRLPGLQQPERAVITPRHAT